MHRVIACLLLVLVVSSIFGALPDRTAFNGEAVLIVDALNAPAAVQNMELGVARTIAASGSRDASIPAFTELSVSRVVDGDSPKLFELAAGGGVIGTVRFHIRRADGVLYEVRCQNVLVSSCMQSGAGDDVVTETITFNYTTISMAVAAIDAQGTIAGYRKAGWDLAANRALTNIPDPTNTPPPPPPPPPVLRDLLIVIAPPPGTPTDAILRINGVVSLQQALDAAGAAQLDGGDRSLEHSVEFVAGTAASN